MYDAEACAEESADIKRAMDGMADALTDVCAEARARETGT